MEPVISPWLFYFIHVCSNISIISTIAAVVCLWALVVLLLAPSSFLTSQRPKIMKKVLIALCTFTFLATFIPSEHILTKMVIANFVTQENAMMIQNNTFEFIEKVAEIVKHK